MPRSACLHRSAGAGDRSWWLRAGLPGKGVGAAQGAGQLFNSGPLPANTVNRLRYILRLLRDFGS